MSEQVAASTGKTAVISGFSLAKFLSNNKRALWPILTLVLILLFNRLIAPDFFTIRWVEAQGRYFGSLIDILNRGAPVFLLAIGMTLVAATKGVDLSVGAVIAICGAVAAVLITTTSIPPLLVILISILVGAVCGLGNGILVAIFDIQPIVATLILMVAGRGIAQMITEGQITVFNNETLSFMGTGLVLGLPFPIYLAAAVFVLVYLFVRRTAIGLLIESVGANDRASYYTGINAALIKLLVYTISGICAAIAGLILTADIKGADSNNAGLWLELDAILAVVIGGTSLNGGRFYLGLSAIGALIIQSIQTGIFLSGFPTTFNLVVQAIVILVVLLIQSDVFRANIFNVIKRMRKPA
jgi:simple sugar transport system permease protein